LPLSEAWFKEFEFDLPRALLRDLVALLDSMEHTPLTEATVSALIPEEQGVYQLFLDGVLVYVGKTDSEAGLNQRLKRHARKIQQRHDLDPGRVSFRAVRIFVFTAIDLEQQLIRHYGAHSVLAWNNSGFGSNDPGRERDTTALKAGHFDLLYPINIDVPLRAGMTGGTLPVSELLAGLKAVVPYVVRHQNAGGRSRAAHPDLVSAVVTLSAGVHTAREILRLVQTALGASWQVTVQPGYVIVYPRGTVVYPHARAL
jgi:hypothetical protein